MSDDATASQFDRLLDGWAADRKVMYGLAHGHECTKRRHIAPMGVLSESVHLPHAFPASRRGAALTRGAWSARLAQVDGGRDDQTDLEADRQVANTLAELIIGGSLDSTEITSKARGGPGCDGQRVRQRDDVTEGAFTNPCTNYMQEALSLFEKGPLALVAGAGFEPATSGL